MRSSASPVRRADRVTEAAQAGRSYALLADGTTMTIRPAAPGDYQAVLRLHEAMSPDNLYFRFFGASRVSAEREAHRVCLDDHPGLAALLGLRGDDLVGVASYELTGDPAAAEIALAVADGMHRRGIATPLLLEHLVSLARARGVKTLVADVLPGNYPVLHVLADAGLTVRRRIGGGVIEISMPIPDNAPLGEASAYLDAVADREKSANVASLAPLLAPRSVAVVGRAVGPGPSAGPSCSASAAAASPAPCTRSARMAATSRASGASRRSPTCPRHPTWRWWRCHPHGSWRWRGSAAGAGSEPWP